MPERHSTTGPGNTSLPVRSRHPRRLGRIRARHAQRAHHPAAHLQVGHEPPVGMYHQPLIQRATHRRRLYAHHSRSDSPPNIPPSRGRASASRVARACLRWTVCPLSEVALHGPRGSGRAYRATIQYGKCRRRSMRKYSTVVSVVLALPLYAESPFDSIIYVSPDLITAEDWRWLREGRPGGTLRGTSRVLRRWTLQTRHRTRPQPGVRAAPQSTIGQPVPT